MSRRVLPLTVALASLWLSAPAAAQGGPDCLTADPPPSGARDLRFGITPGIAGSAGVDQGSAAPIVRDKEREALLSLEQPRRKLILRLNRLFWADGRRAIRRFARRVDRYARAGLASEVQVRYHPPEGREGDMRAWSRFVRAATRRLARRPSLAALSITNEINFPISPNTSDGSYDRALRAMVRGVSVAQRVLRRAGRPRLPLGFSVAWRYFPEEDAKLWERLGEIATPRFRRALDYVGLQVYPGLVWPPTRLPGRTPGQEVVEALTLLRNCYMPKARLGRKTDLWVSENGYTTKPGVSTEAQQAADLVDTIESVHDVAGTLNVTDYRYFNLRDNDSEGADLFAQVGLLRDDYTRKPAFAELRELIRRYGR